MTSITPAVCQALHMTVVIPTVFQSIFAWMAYVISIWKHLASLRTHAEFGVVSVLQASAGCRVEQLNG
jgi:hypothetical protein